VRRVRDELPLRAQGFVERGEHRVEARAEAAELVVAGRRDATREVARLGYVRRRLAQPAYRRERRRRDERAEGRRQADPPEGEQSEGDPKPA
jgi:hypothetical protein